MIIGLALQVTYAEEQGVSCRGKSLASEASQIGMSESPSAPGFQNIYGIAAIRLNQFVVCPRICGLLKMMFSPISSYSVLWLVQGLPTGITIRRLRSWISNLDGEICRILTALRVYNNTTRASPSTSPQATRYFVFLYFRYYLISIGRSSPLDVRLIFSIAREISPVMLREFLLPLHITGRDASVHTLK